MKTINIEVPRLLVKSHHQHPEPYGESIVVLVNDMYTDVYTDENGRLVTITNDKKLVDYLKLNNKADPIISLKKSSVELRTLQYADRDLLKTWFNGKKNWLKTAFDYSREDIETYISHSITAVAHQFLLLEEKEPIGQLGYQKIGEDIILNLSIYEIANDNNQINLALNLLIEHLSNNYNYSQLLMNVLDEDDYHISLLKEYGFKEDKSQKLSIKVSEPEIKASSVYVLMKNKKDN